MTDTPAEAHRRALRVEIATFVKAHPEGYLLRSCWECNDEHHFLKKHALPLRCIACGHWFLRGEKATEEGSF